MYGSMTAGGYTDGYNRTEIGNARKTGKFTSRGKGELMGIWLTCSAISAKPVNTVGASEGISSLTESGARPTKERSRTTRWLSGLPALGTSPQGDVRK